MAFPINPSPGQQANVNGVLYTYSSSLTAWTVTSSGGALLTANSITTSGNISTSNTVYGNILSVSNIVNASGNGIGNIGNSSSYFNTVFAKSTSAQYADLAEIYQADEEYAPGTLVIFGGECEITVSTVSHDTRVAGVVSTNPAYVMNSTSAGIPIALTGRVPCWIQGPVSKGDRLVNIAKGTAGKFDPQLGEIGCIIGKSLVDVVAGKIWLGEIAVGRY